MSYLENITMVKNCDIYEKRFYDHLTIFVLCFPLSNFAFKFSRKKYVLGDIRKTPNQINY